jgi:hypothetical protein
VQNANATVIYRNNYSATIGSGSSSGQITVNWNRQ